MIRAAGITGNSGAIRAHSSSETIHGGCCPFLPGTLNQPVTTAFS
jgi:hypothetical protein